MRRTADEPSQGEGEPLASTEASRTRKLSWWWWAASGVALAALISAFVDPEFGFNPGSVRVVLSLLVSFAIDVALGWLIVIWVMRRLVPGATHTFLFRPATLLVVVAAVVFSRLTGFEPGIVFGLVAGVASAPRRQGVTGTRCAGHARLCVHRRPRGVDAVRAARRRCGRRGNRSGRLPDRDAERDRRRRDGRAAGRAIPGARDGGLRDLDVEPMGVGGLLADRPVRVLRRAHADALRMGGLSRWDLAAWIGIYLAYADRRGRRVAAHRAPVASRRRGGRRRRRTPAPSDDRPEASETVR